MWGFDEGHVTILSSEAFLATYNDILEKTRDKASSFHFFGSTQ